MAHYDLETISELLIESITDLFDEFGMDYIDGVSTISFTCPIHESSQRDNKNSSILKRNIGNWRCYSSQCHEEYGNSSGASIIHFVQAWLTTNNGRKYTLPEAIEWCAKFVGVGESTRTIEDSSRLDFIKLCKYINRKKQTTPVFTPRLLVRDFLAIPSAYYMKRGYSKTVLEKFDVGYCHNDKKSFYDRVVTPFYDDSGQYMVGASARSRYEKCTKCNMFHNATVRCPITKQEKLKCYKWKHSSLFNADDYLYNYWNAKEHIVRTGTVIVVEGPGDVWRFEEAGIFNSVAMLKATLSPGQQYIIETSGAINLVVATDMDEAGQKGANTILNNCGRLFNTQRVKFPKNDIGDLEVQQTQEIFNPILEKL